MMLAEVLRQGFALARHRPGLIFVDLLWKAIWGAATLVAFALIAGWFGGQLQNIEWQDTGVPALNGLLAATVLRQFWNAHASKVLWALFSVSCFSVALWLLLEAFFRWRIIAGHLVAAGFTPAFNHHQRFLRRNLNAGVKPAATSLTFRGFLISGVIKSAILSSVAFMLGLIVFGRYLATPPSEWRMLWLETRGATIAGIVAFIGVAFFLTVLDTLLRSDAVELLGVDLIRVSGMIGILLLFEAMIGASVSVVIVAGFLNVSRGVEAIVMLVVTVLGVILLNLFHSYLLLVRFSAVDIMRRNVVGI
jgi:hypothetical protein